jgi:hypothetical protein
MGSGESKRARTSWNDLMDRFPVAEPVAPEVTHCRFH